jgi:hypothetical protein
MDKDIMRTPGSLISWNKTTIRIFLSDCLTLTIWIDGADSVSEFYSIPKSLINKKDSWTNIL